MIPPSVRDAQGFVEELIESGQFLEAIDALTELNEAKPRDEFEVTLAELRRDAFAELEHLTPATSDAEPAPIDPFPGQVGVPEIAREQLTAELLQGALHHHGVVMVRGLADPAAARMLSDDVDRAFEAQARWREGTPVSETSPWFVPLDNHQRYPLNPTWAIGRQLERFKRVLTVDSPRVLFGLMQALRAAGLDRVLSAYLGARPVLGENKFCVRQMPYRANGVSNLWHQEASVFGAQQRLRAVNMWLALSECGTNSPAIEFLPAPMSEIVTAEKAYAVRAERAREATGHRPLGSPDFEPGDGVLFSELVFHRTRQHEDMTGLRRNVEAWFFSPWSHPRHNGCVVF